MLTEDASAAVAAEEGAPVGPSAEEEAAFLAGNPTEAAAIRAVRAAPSAETEPEPVGELPPLEDLVKRIPMPTRDLMEELFRARFVTVKRVPGSALK